MASIASGLKKRGSKYLYEGNFAGAVECFNRAYLLEPDDKDNLIDLIYSLNQNADYVTALCYCYGLLGMAEYRPDTVYFLTAEAFGGVGCAEACAQMLQRCLDVNPNGQSSADATAFLNDLKQKYSLEEYDASTNCVNLAMPNGLNDAPFLNYETLLTMKDVSALVQLQDFNAAVKRIEDELETGNITVSLLGVALMMGAELDDIKYIKRNAERFKFVEDYTLSELHSLAYNLTELADDDIAYTVYRELYSKESGDKDISFGFAVACEHIGDIAYARNVAKGVSMAEGGVGPATSYLDEIGKRTHSYMLRFENDAEERICNNIKSNTLKGGKDIMEASKYMAFADAEFSSLFIENADMDDLVYEMELRRLAMAPECSLLLRSKAATKLFEKHKKIYLNTGTDIVEFSDDFKNIINNFFERGTK